LGPYATGLYNLAKRLTSAVYLVITASLLRVSLPVFAAASGKPEQLRQAYLQLLAMMLFLMLPMLLFQAALAEPLVATVFGQKWLPASSTIAALALLYCLSSVAELNNYVLFALGHSRWPPLLGILQLSLAVILAACFSQYGLLAMSLSFAAAYLLMLPWSQHLACKAMDLPWTTFLVALQPVLAGAAALLLTLYAMARWWQGSAIVLLVLALFAGAIAYLLPMLLLGRALRGTAGGFDPFSLLRQLRNLKHRGAAAD
jgi:O-antigen/teichoic acid export membrane protein